MPKSACRPSWRVCAFPLSLIACLGLHVEAVAAQLPLSAGVSDGRLTLQAEGASLAEVLRAIGEAGGFEVVLRGDLAEPVHRSLADQPLENALRDLAGGHALIVIHGDAGDQRITEIRVRARPAVAVEPATPGTARADVESAPAAREEAYRQRVRAYIPPTRHELLLALTEPDPTQRIAAVPKVGSLEPAEAIAVVGEIFARDDDPAVRSRAVAALTRLEGAEARRLLRERAVADPDAGLRAQALRALASSRGEQAVNVLARALRRDPEPSVRRAAIKALGRLGGDWARSYLERVAPRLSPDLRVVAEQALAEPRSE